MSVRTHKSIFSPTFKQCFVTAAVSTNVLGHGCTFGYPSVLLPQLHLPDALVPLNSNQDSWIASTMPISMLIGNFITPLLMDRFGRRPAHIAVAAPAILGWVATFFATSFQMLIIGRALQGLSLGIMFPLRSILVAEYTSPKYRGGFITTVSVAQGLGVLFVHLIGSLLSWQVTALICAIFPLLSVAMTLYTPETPSYLASKGKYDQCRTVFHWLRGYSEEDELEEMIRASMISEKEQKIDSVKELLVTIKKKEFYKPVLLGMHARGMIQFAGVANVSAYATVILEILLDSDSDLNFWMVVLDALNLVASVAVLFIINRLRRRTMMLSASLFSIIVHVAIAGYVFARVSGFLSFGGLWLPLLLIHLQYLALGAGMVPIPNVITGEVFPLRYRSFGSFMSIVSYSGTNFIILKTFPGLIESVGLEGAYALYAAVLLYALIVVMVLLPETKGKTLQQIEDEFKGKVEL